MSSEAHWESVYRKKGADQVSWFRPHLERSLEFIESAGLARDAAIIDVGGGASTLVDDLLARGYTNLTVLDLSATALDAAKARLGPLAARVRWMVGDVCTARLPERAYDLWHDRAVFHFLREELARRRYLEAARRALPARGQMVIATFALEGPERCSGLEVVRYDADSLLTALGGSFVKLASCNELHTTPWGSAQQFLYCHCRVA